MALSLYDLGVSTFLQTTRSIAGVLDRTTRHCAEVGTDPDDFVGARLYPDMAPFHFQIESLKNHAVWGIEAARTGAFTPPPLVGAVPFADLVTSVLEAVAALEAFTPDEINRHAGRSFEIEIFRPLAASPDGPWGPRRLRFTPETLLLSYSLPNFHFHAVTAYAILRSRGVPLGKADYEGVLRTSGT